MTDYFENGKTYEGTYTSGRSGKLRVKVEYIHSDGTKMLVHYSSSRDKLQMSHFTSARIETWKDVAQVAYFKTKGGAEVKVWGCREVVG